VPRQTGAFQDELTCLPRRPRQVGQCPHNWSGSNRVEVAR
jgi:hypothetical protein